MHEKYMQYALKEAQKGYLKDEIPVGTIIVLNDKIISKSHNTKEIKKDCTCHAEINAIKKACKKNKDWRLNNCTLYTTLEPCSMCMGAIAESRIKEVYFGSLNENNHFINKIICENYKIKLTGGILEKKCNDILKSFFERIRN